jgi:hypothetical protein
MIAGLGRWLVLAMAGALLMGAAAPEAAVPPDPALALLDRLAGTWDSPGTFVDSAYSKAGTARATTTCAWSDDRFFLICQQSVVMNGKPAHDVAIYTYDPAAKTYRFYNVGVASSSGTPIGVTKDAITYSGSFTDGDKHVLTRTSNVWSSPQRYAWRSEYSLDGGTSWTLMASGIATRIR